MLAAVYGTGGSGRAVRMGSGTRTGFRTVNTYGCHASPLMQVRASYEYVPKRLRSILHNYFSYGYGLVLAP
eukprot:scaffold424214_cov23-Prasinocladus_malaysianus.AAC.1